MLGGAEHPARVVAAVDSGHDGVGAGVETPGRQGEIALARPHEDRRCRAAVHPHLDLFVQLAQPQMRRLGGLRGRQRDIAPEPDQGDIGLQVRRVPPGPVAPGEGRRLPGERGVAAPRLGTRRNGRPPPGFPLMAHLGFRVARVPGVEGVQGQRRVVAAQPLQRPGPDPAFDVGARPGRLHQPDGRAGLQPQRPAEVVADRREPAHLRRRGDPPRGAAPGFGRDRAGGVFDGQEAQPGVRRAVDRARAARRVLQLELHVRLARAEEHVAGHDVAGAGRPGDGAVDVELIGSAGGHRSQRRAPGPGPVRRGLSRVRAERDLNPRARRGGAADPDRRPSLHDGVVGRQAVEPDPEVAGPGRAGGGQRRKPGDEAGKHACQGGRPVAHGAAETPSQ